MTPVKAPRRVELVIGGMTCASCANRVERKLGKLAGVTATVNYATEKAQVTYPDGIETADLVAQVESAGYTATLPTSDAEGAADAASGADDPARPLRDRTLIAAALALPVVALSMVPAWQFTYWQWIALTLAAPVVVWGALPFHRAAWTNLKHGAASMDTLVSLGTLAALGWSLYALLWGGAGVPGMVHAFRFTVSRGDAGGSIYLEVAAGVTVFVLAGRWAEARSKRRAGAALRALLKVGAKEATLLRDGVEVQVPATQLAVGDRFLVRPGETLAADGVIERGRSALDTAVVTGEAVPREVQTGDAVVGGCTNVGGRLVVRATRVGSDTQLARMGRMVEEAQNGKAQVQRLADRVSGVFVPIVIALAVATLGWWLGSGAGAGAAFTAAVAVLIVACPCALGLATPTALLVGTGRGAQLGLIVRGPEVLESTRRVDTIVLDKTGTLTTGRMSVHEVVAISGAASECAPGGHAEGPDLHGSNIAPDEAGPDAGGPDGARPASIVPGTPDAAGDNIDGADPEGSGPADAHSVSATPAVIDHAEADHLVTTHEIAGPAESRPAGPGTTDSGPAGPGPADGGPEHSGPAGPGPDGPADSGPADSGPADSGPADSGPADSGPADSGPADSGPADSGPDGPDGPDGPGPRDSGPADSGPDGPDGPGPGDSGDRREDRPRNAYPTDGGDAGREALRLAAALEAGSEHPVGRAIATAGRARCGELPDVAEFDNAPGLGVRGVVSELEGDTIVAHAVLVGRPELLAEHGIPLPAELDRAIGAARSRGETAVAVAWDGVARAVIAVGDTLADGSVEAVRRLRALGLHPVLLTGDHPEAARATAAQVGIDEIVADVLPQDKVAAVRRWQADGRVVAMVGDGVNDAAALATADLGIAMGTGTDAAIEASDLTLVHGDLRAAVDAIRLARHTLAVIRANLFWAFAYNVAALPLAASGLLNPMIAGAAMAASSVFVVSNSLRLRRFHPQSDAAQATHG